MTQIICISRGSLSRGKELAEALASRLDYAVLSREDLIEAAIKDGIQVGKLETSMMNARSFTERLARERDHYLAFSTAYLCDRALQGPLVYHGRTGHLLLRGIQHVMRVRVIADEEYRIKVTMRDLKVDREKARRYLTAVEDDRRTWVRSMYGVSWEDASQYDVTVSVERMNVENAAAALVGMAQLPDFRMTPASKRAMDDLRLAANARLRLARDARTARAQFAVRAHDGAVIVTYLPKDMEVADVVPAALAGLPGMADFSTTVAATNILWVQETFDPASETFDEVTEIARKWNAAVELVQFESGDGGEGGAVTEVVTAVDAVAPVGGIEEDTDAEPADRGGFRATLDALAEAGRSGGGRRVHGERRDLLTSCCGPVQYSLVVLGSVFLSRGAAVRQRLTRELQDTIGSRLRVPVVTAEDLRARYLFGGRDVLRLGGFLATVAVLYALVFANQRPVLEFLFGRWSGGGVPVRLGVAAAIFAFVPVIAYCYGSVVRIVMKLIKME
jgi:cytidylate kinase